MCYIANLQHNVHRNLISPIEYSNQCPPRNMRHIVSGSYPPLIPSRENKVPRVPHIANTTAPFDNHHSACPVVCLHGNCNNEAVYIRTDATMPSDITK